jgi:hypothetical protein
METRDRYDKSEEYQVWRLHYGDTHGKKWITKFVRKICFAPLIGIVTYELGADQYGGADQYSYFPKADATRTWRMLVTNWCAVPISFAELETLELQYYGLAQ